ncbi:hypothetical protein Y032_0004g2174 [Ancylostoma ceylanicum]|nr:hypothetical protein Y032_0004g2174 [Ancylostoma ceylanicum]
MKFLILFLLCLIYVADSKSQLPRRCKQKMDVGLCRASLPRFFYNSTSRKCEEFIYGGCGGNKNNFDDENECRKKCMRK